MKNEYGFQKIDFGTVPLIISGWANIKAGYDNIKIEFINYSNNGIESVGVLCV